jgi:hypothetical protein
LAQRFDGILGAESRQVARQSDQPPVRVENCGAGDLSANTSP